MWIPISEGYKHPVYTYMGVTDKPKLVSALTTEEKLLYDREKKALATLSMCLPLDIYHTCKEFTTSHDLWEGYYHLLSEIVNNDIGYKNINVLEKFLDALPAHFEMYTIVIKAQSGFDELGLEDLMGKIQSNDLNKQKKDTVYQDPRIYFGKGTSTQKSGVALFSRDIFDCPKESSCNEGSCFVVSSYGCSQNSMCDNHSCYQKMSPKATDDMML
ncbi:hypothetical protein L1987_45818 [Smallanthus sonchifolius]|uniref:Uncharacterized protein n=1 Tax=Smallanthus sonchifolius TaxID=185202 RepID=A0ACB9FZ19_9ASTR|nr:hypothetical protein L1987_45818 [Smallanthus sonchifolius]